MVSNASEVPVIGISTYLEETSWGDWSRRAALLPENYLTAVTKAGAIPVLLPPMDVDVATVLRRLDGLLLAGGADLTPESYGAQAHPKTIGVRPERDGWEHRLLEAALAVDMPVLAVCRGAQLLNVACGGTLHQHLPEVVGNDTHRISPGVFGPVSVRLDEQQLPGSLLGSQVKVRCYHHQSLDALGSGLVASGWAEDGTVEAVVLPDREFVVGVQWHPEETLDDVRLFAAFTEAARRPS
ncbi:gamma-glutamyl-gamma-aminobutyrate hydrolase family protein [Allokutzneria sp. A3M-2-11 16]|uniref:gamma-glutamyl-gamma-aminobutyrate hydrolase family protein n=1 Tax=Allokutzneria sp. A3M-2-11 16 TaxID=2962043 RepID=UPI0020B7A79B|nr:gamma-glutamyl-gamma-aminobutyrate hydrolase family protein [Allokutzneria sp. A3M-2-11 16]MCP3805481.1 gamma-glutamyl-gamma-aminobutyrate hydrolase family protein [Allokutzneria sp. A3M-2-11 16]